MHEMCGVTSFIVMVGGLTTGLAVAPVAGLPLPFLEDFPPLRIPLAAASLTVSTIDVVRALSVVATCTPPSRVIIELTKDMAWPASGVSMAIISNTGGVIPSLAL